MKNNPLTECVALPICVSIAHHEASILQLMINPYKSIDLMTFLIEALCIAACWLSVSRRCSYQFRHKSLLLLVLSDGSDVRPHGDDAFGDAGSCERGQCYQCYQVRRQLRRWPSFDLTIVCRASNLLRGIPETYAL